MQFLVARATCCPGARARHRERTGGHQQNRKSTDDLLWPSATRTTSCPGHQKEVYPSMVLISTGSTCTSFASNQATAFLISSRSPSSSNAMIPMVGVTDALRMLKTTSNVLLIS